MEQEAEAADSAARHRFLEKCAEEIEQRKIQKFKEFEAAEKVFDKQFEEEYDRRIAAAEAEAAAAPEPAERSIDQSQRLILEIERDNIKIRREALTAVRDARASRLPAASAASVTSSSSKRRKVVLPLVQ